MTEIKVYPPEAIRQRMQELSHQAEPAEFQENRKGPIIGEIDQALKNRGDDPDYLRKLVLGWLTNKEDETMGGMSSKLLTPQQWNGLWMWIGSEKVEDKWLPRAAFPVECNWVCTRAMYDYNRFLEFSKLGKPFMGTMKNLLSNAVHIPDLPEKPIEINTDQIIQITMQSMPGILPIGDSLKNVTTASEASKKVMHRLQNKETGIPDDMPDDDMGHETNFYNIDNDEKPEPTINRETDDEPEFGY